MNLPNEYKGGWVMAIAVWIIALCEVVRTIQNAIQLLHVKESERQYKRATTEFVNSLKKTDKEFVKEMLEEFKDE
jgi:DNA-binding IscR family transcriptional regulator